MTASIKLGISSCLLGNNDRYDKRNKWDKGTEAQIIWSVFITQLMAVLEATYYRYPESIKWDFIAVGALAFMLIGFILRIWSLNTLGKHFTMHLEVQEDHKVIRNGPYSIVRHPSSTGAFLTYMGTSIFLHSWYSAIIAVILLPLAWVRRIKYEEEMLRDSLGEEYESKWFPELQKLDKICTGHHCSTGIFKSHDRL